MNKKRYRNPLKNRDLDAERATEHPNSEAKPTRSKTNSSGSFGMLAYIPFALIVILILGAYFSGIYRDFNFQWLKAEHLKIKEYAELHPYLASLYFLLIYIVSVVLIIPDALLLTLIGGMLFPLPVAILFACFSETLGATLFFEAAKLLTDNAKPLKKSHLLHEMQHKIKKDQIYYLLFFRLSHLLPFWLINFASALFRIRPWTFIWTTLIGVLPFAILFSQAGLGLSHYLETHEQFAIRDILNPQMKLSLAIASLLALTPLILKYFRKKKR